MGWFMRTVNVLVAIFIAGCNIWVSLNHSLDLFRTYGFHGGLEYGAVAAVEAAFLLGGFNIIVARLKGYDPGLPAKLGGLLGVSIVSWSNAAAVWDYGWKGVALGLTTPISLIIAEGILSHAILQSSKRVRAKLEKKKPGVIKTVWRWIWGLLSGAWRFITGGRKSPEAQNLEKQNLEQELEKLDDEKGNTVEDTLESNLEETAESPVESTVELTQVNATQTSKETLESVTPEEIELEKANLEGVNLEEKKSSKPKLERKSPKRVLEGEPPKLSKREYEEEVSKLDFSGESPKEVALQVYEQFGKLLTRNMLMELADCKEWAARTALKEVKEELKVKKAS